ncbi:MAG: aldo/keto reductase [Dysgonamonadaceae bacterium]|jgi:aryl-alcohol dehydrogenase-like predicted oxidoreductase|nr:aldo/keto reductase [Dysgonamonadaceae bacterium]
MDKINRRKFIRTGLTGVAGLSVVGSGTINLGFTVPDNLVIDKVKLGNSGLTVSRVAMGTGTVGYNKASNQTRLGMDKFVKLAHHAYERGITFYDMADGYGSHPYVGAALKTLPREKVTLLTKIWTHEEGSGKIEPVDKILDRIRTETGSDYFDIVLLHCMMKGDWNVTRRYYMDALSKAKQDGIVKALGVSCHNIDALAEAAVNPWVDVIMARLNPFGTAMDGTPEVINAILAKAKENGKGVIGMKIFGEGKHVRDDERQKSITFALTKGNIHCMTLGLESEAQLDDAVKRIMAQVK